MENKINIAELLKDCPMGMKLYSPIFGEVYLDKVRPHLGIVVTTDKYKEEFLYDGRYGINGECMLFPSKSKTTWEGFQRPFVDGDIVYTSYDNKDGYIFIFESITENTHVNSYLHLKGDDLRIIKTWLTDCDDKYFRHATEKEKQKLFDAIKANGYKWNEETKTLEKLPKFKVRDRIKYINGKNKDGVKEGIILSITNDTYDVAVTNDMGIFVPISEQDNWELVPNKFNISNLKPFDKVLVRCDNNGLWNPQFFAKYRPHSKFPFTCTYNSWSQCVPYEGNEHLLDTTDDCNEYFKTW